MVASYARTAVSVASLGYLPDDNYRGAYGVIGKGQIVVSISGLQSSDSSSRFPQSADPSQKIFQIQNLWRDWAAENALDR